MRCAEHPFACWLGLVALAAAVFGFWPAIDPAVTRVFWVDGGFPLAGSGALNLLREALWDASLGLFAIAVAMTGWTLWRGPLRGIGPRVWGFVAGLYLLGPGLLVNGILKNNWGRARPAQTLDFGGQADFTPFWQITDQCRSNCSFVSGEGSAAVALAVSVFVLLAALRPQPATGLRRALQALALVLAAAGLFQRLATGRHFLSDTVFAVLVVAGVALVLRRLLLRRAG